LRRFDKEAYRLGTMPLTRDAFVSVAFENRSYTVEFYDSSRVVIVTRSAMPFESPLDIHEQCEPVQATLDALGRSELSLLIDSREAKGRNDPEFERAFASHRRRMAMGFKRGALLLKTTAGKLHSDRLVREDGIARELVVFTDYDEAVNYLLSGGPSATRSSVLPRRK
jgi:hypothetical protein